MKPTAFYPSKSLPGAFIALLVTRWLFALVITEIHYHPPGSADVSRRFEFIEIYNEEPDPRDLTGYHFADGVSFAFPDRLFIEGHAHLVVCADEDFIRDTYGVSNTVGNWSTTTALDNGGERITLANAAGQVVSSVRYNDRGRWSAGADGAGHSIALVDPYTDVGESEHWALSREPRGTPGAKNFPDGAPRPGVVFNEGLTWTEGKPWIELYNSGDETADLSGFFLSDDRDNLDRAALAPGTTLAPGAWLVVAAEDLGLDLEVDGLVRDRVWVALVHEDGKRVVDAFTFRPPEAEASEARVPDGYGRVVSAATPTRGVTNQVEIEMDVVINEIQYNPIHDDPGREFIELYNRGDQSMALAGWRLDRGVNFEFPAEAVIPAGGFVIVARNPQELRDIYSGDGRSFDVFGPEGDPGALEAFGVLRNTGENIVLLDARGNVADSVRYHDGGKWPRWADGGGSTLELIDAWQDNNCAQAWDASDDSGKAESQTFEYMKAHRTGGSVAESTLQVLDLDRGIVLVDNLHIPGPPTTEILIEEVFVSEGEAWKIFLGTEEPPAEWRSADFDDSSWRLAATPMGYGEKGLATEFPELRFKARAVYCRKTFEIGSVAGVEAIEQLLIELDYDDGFVAYLNGSEILRENINGNPPDFQSEATKNRESGEPISANLRTGIALLVPGTNVLAVQVHNNRINSPDMYFTTRLSSGREIEIPEGWNMVPGGDFESELDDNWMFRGTHFDSGLTTTNPIEGAGSLKVVASGSGDQKINRLEVEIPFGLATNKAYTVSLDARWVVGSRTILTQGHNFGLGREHRLHVPEDLGSPGEVNGVTIRQVEQVGEANLGPVVDSVTQLPVLPGSDEPVTIRARVQDRDGVERVTLRTTENSVENAFAEIPMTGPDTRGFYSAVVPGHAEGTRVIYEIVALDSRGRRGRFPVDHTQRSHPMVLDPRDEALAHKHWAVYGHADYTPDPGQQQFRFWIHDEEEELLSEGVHSDHYVRGTLVHDDRCIYYGTGFHFQGSALSRNRWSSFRIRMPQDRPLHDRVPRFNLDVDGPEALDRIVNKIISNNTGGLGIPHNVTHSFSSFDFNDRQFGQRVFVEPPGKSRLRRWYPSDDDGDMFEADERYIIGRSGVAQTRQNARWLYPPYRNEGPASEAQSYRFYFSHRTNKGRDNWNEFMEAARFMDPGQTRDPEFDEKVFDQFNVEEIVRVLTVRQNTADEDCYGVRWGRSAYLYRPEIDGRWNYIAWDSDKSFYIGGLTPEGSFPLPDNPSGVFRVPSFPEIQRFYNRPRIKRIHYAVLKEMVDTHFNSDYLQPFIDGIVALGASQRSTDVARPGGWIDQRAEYIRGWLSGSVFPQQRLEIDTNGGQDLTLDADTVTLVGKAPAEIRFIVVLRDGRQLSNQPDVVFSDNDFFGWSLTDIPLVPGSSQLELVGMDFQGNVVDSDSIEVTTTRQGIGPFVRGDCNGDGFVQGGVSDAVAILIFGFAGGNVSCRAACDGSGDGVFDATTDALFVLSHNFLGTASPPHPFPGCGESIRPGDAALGCEDAAACP